MNKQVKMLKICLVKSAIRKPEKQKKILRGLGLNRINKVKSLLDTHEIRGMINKVKHLIKFVD